MFEFNLGQITLNKHKIVLQKWILDDKKTQIVLRDDQITQIVGATSTLNKAQFAHKLTKCQKEISKRKHKKITT